MKLDKELVDKILKSEEEIRNLPSFKDNEEFRDSIEPLLVKVKKLIELTESMENQHEK